MSERRIRVYSTDLRNKFLVDARDIKKMHLVKKLGDKYLGPFKKFDDSRMAQQLDYRDPP